MLEGGCWIPDAGYWCGTSRTVCVLVLMLLLSLLLFLCLYSSRNCYIRLINYLNKISTALVPLYRRGPGSGRGSFLALFALSLVCFIWGTTYIAARQAVLKMPALQMVAIRQFLGGSVYVVYFLSKKEQWPKGREWHPVLVLSFLNFMLSNALSTWGVKYISAGLGAIIAAIFPLWLFMIGFFRPSSKFPLKSVVGLLLGFLGICVIFYEHLADFLLPDFRVGIFLSLLSTISWAFGTLYTKEQASKFNPYFSLGLQMTISSLVLYTAATYFGMTIPFQLIPFQSWLAISYLVIFGSVISFVAYVYALQHLPIGVVSVYAYINPVVAVLFGAMLFDEKLSVFIAAGAIVTLAGVYLVNESFRKTLPVKRGDGNKSIESDGIN